MPTKYLKKPQRCNIIEITEKIGGSKAYGFSK
jgi:hypothetical protein